MNEKTKSKDKEYSLDDKILLTVKDICKLTGFGETKVRKILNNKNSKFTVRLGNRLFANRILFEEWLQKCAKYQIPIG